MYAESTRARLLVEQTRWRSVSSARAITILLLSLLVECTARAELGEDYFEAGLGPGLAWKIRPDVTFEAEAGNVVHRPFDFWRQDLTFRRPYVQVASRVRFWRPGR